MSRDPVRYFPGNHRSGDLIWVCATLAKLALFGAIMALVF